MENTDKRINLVKLWLFIGIPILFAVGALLHFLYDWTGGNGILGIFLPVNESVWEHLKLFYWPVLVWYIIGYIILSHRKYVSLFKWTVALAAVLLAGLLFIVAFSYTYTGAFGVQHIVWLDIASYFVALALAMMLAYHIIKYLKCSTVLFPISLLLVIIIGAAFVYFTFCPPNLPLFMNP